MNTFSYLQVQVLNKHQMKPAPSCERLLSRSKTGGEGPHLEDAPAGRPSASLGRWRPLVEHPQASPCRPAGRWPPVYSRLVWRWDRAGQQMLPLAPDGLDVSPLLELG